ncbi:MAG: leucine-rich repeat domain-containing protein [Muribaculaceae bacterium]|nr:leucine-rich repeat domain-containing protein [Muribaculaceae bacterium]
MLRNLLLTIALLSGVSAAHGQSVDLDVEVLPGELKSKISGSGFERIDNLKISGTLNGDDWMYLTQGSGLIASVAKVDVSDVDFVLDGSIYRNVSFDSGSMGVQVLTEYRFWPRDSVSTDYTLDGGRTTYWGRSLAGGFQNTEFSEVALPATLPALGANIFRGAKKLSMVTFGGSENCVGGYAFYDCESLTDIKLPESVETIEEYAFSNTALVRVDIGNVVNVGAALFEGIETLKNVDFGNGLEEIPISMFEKCISLESVGLPETLKRIGDRAFFGTALQAVDLPQGLESIGEMAFGCSNLETIEIPESVSSIGGDAFYKTPFEKTLVADNGVVYVGNVAYKVNDSETTEIVFRNGTKGLSSGLCSYFDRLERVVLPEGLTDIGNAAFYCCNISEPILPNSVRNIGDEAFAGNQIKTLRLPDSLRRIGKKCFSYNPLTSVTIPENVVYLGGESFGHNSRLVSIEYNAVAASTTDVYGNAEDPFWQSSADRITFGKNVRIIPDRLFRGMTGCNAAVAELPEGLERIGEMAFCGMGSVTDINLPESLRYIGDYAFSETSLKKIVLGEAIEYVGNEAFGDIRTMECVEYNCVAAKSAHYTYVSQLGPVEVWGKPFKGTTASSVTFGDKVADIPASFFEDSRFDCEIWLPDGVALGKYAFYQSGIAGIRLPADMTEIPEGLCGFCDNLSSVIFPEDAERIDKYAFDVCRSLSVSELPKSLRSIGERAFLEVRFDSDLILPPYLETIGDRAFMNSSWTAIQNIFIPETVREIGNGALLIDASSFRHGVRVKTMGETVPTCENGNPFDYNWQCERNKYWTLIAPEKSLKEYASAEGWRNFETTIANGSMTLEAGKLFSVEISECRDDAYCQGNVIDHVYYSLNYPSMSGDAALGRIDETVMDKISGMKIGNYDLYHEGFRGLIVEIPEGKGDLVVEPSFQNADCLITIKIGDGESVKFSADKESHSVAYDVTSPTYAYIYNTDYYVPGVKRISVIPEGAGAEGVLSDVENLPVRRFHVDGRVASESDKGVVIEVTSDGSARKVVR